jgi:hypothetical protein
MADAADMLHITPSSIGAVERLASSSGFDAPAMAASCFSPKGG